jgi:hypothetical protein
MNVFVEFCLLARVALCDKLLRGREIAQERLMRSKSIMPVGLTKAADKAPTTKYSSAGDEVCRGGYGGLSLA